MLYTHVPSEANALADLIEQGLRHGGMEESTAFLLEPRDAFGPRERAPEKPFCGCALGIALVGKFDDPEIAYKHFCAAWSRHAPGDPVAGACDALGIGERIGRRVSEAHEDGQRAAEIAKRIRRHAA